MVELKFELRHDLGPEVDLEVILGLELLSVVEVESELEFEQGPE